jgi:hypothetical protein
MGCRGCDSSRDLYVILEGPWLLSIANCSYLRAVTTHIDGHDYKYQDPRPNPNAGCTTDLGKGSMFHFNVTSSSGKAGTVADPSSLFDSMRSKHQGIFYNGNVHCPASFGDLKVHEVQFSYPDAIFPMELLCGVTFNNLDAVQSGQVKEWPTVIVMRYSNWRTAVFNGDYGPGETIARGAGQIHRLLSIRYTAPTLSGCAQDEDAVQHACHYFSTLMQLLTYPGQTQPPVPCFPKCDGQHIPVSHIFGGDGCVETCELDGTHPCHEQSRSTTLVNCASGGGGVEGGG